MKRPVIVLLLCLLEGSLAWWRLHEATDATSAPVESPQVKGSQEMAAKADRMSDEQTSTASKPSVLSAPTTSPAPSSAKAAVADNDKTGPRHKRAYMLSLDQGALALVEAQDIEGDFAQKRGPEEVWSNMLRCQLMSETNTVLAEELLPAPDQVCAVLDPRSSTNTPVNFSNPGPVIFQVRLPRVKDARRLNVSRILQPGPPTRETLLGSLPLPPP